MIVHLKQSNAVLDYDMTNNREMNIRQVHPHENKKSFKLLVSLPKRKNGGKFRHGIRWHSLMMLVSVIIVMLFFNVPIPYGEDTSPRVANAVMSMSTMMSVEANSTLIAAGEAVSFILTLYYQDQDTLVWTPLADHQVTFTWLNDTSRVATLITDSEGQARVTWILTTSVYGQHAFNATFDGTTEYLSSWDVLHVEIRSSLPSENSPSNDIWFLNPLINGSNGIVAFNADDTMELTVTLQAGGGFFLGPGVFKLFDDTMGIELYHEDVPQVFDTWNYPSYSITTYWKVPLHAPEGTHVLRLWYSGDDNVRQGSITKQINVTVQLGLRLQHSSTILRSQENLTVTTTVLGPTPENKRVLLQFKPDGGTQWENLTPQEVVNRMTTFVLQPNKTWLVGNYTIRAELQSLDGNIVHAIAYSSFILLGQSQVTVSPSSDTLHANRTITFTITAHAKDSLTQAVPSILTVIDVTDDILVFNGTTDVQGEMIVSWKPFNLTLGIHELNFSVIPTSPYWKPSSTVLSMQYVAGSTLVPQSLPVEVTRGDNLNVTVSVYREDTGSVIVDPSLKVLLTPRDAPNTVLDETYLLNDVVALTYQIPPNEPSGPRDFTVHFVGNATLDYVTYNFTVNVIVPTRFLGYAINYSTTKTISAGMTLEITARLGDNTNSQLIGQKVTVTIGSSIVLQGITDASGWMIVFWNIPLSQPTQLYSIKIEFTGNASAYLLAADNTILDSVTVTPPLGITALETPYRGTTTRVLVTGPGNEQVTVRWYQQRWNSSSRQWEYQDVKYQVTLNSSGQFELSIMIPENVMVGTSYWYLNSTLDPDLIVMDTLEMRSTSVAIHVSLPPNPILVGISYQYSVTAEFAFDVYVDGLQITTTPQDGWSTYFFNRVLTTRGTHSITVTIADSNVIPYLDQTEQVSTFIVKEAIVSSVTGPTKINVTDSAQFMVRVTGNVSNVGVNGATTRVSVVDAGNGNVSITSVVTTTDVNGEAIITLSNFTKGKYFLNFTVWHDSDPFWYGTVTQELSLTVWDATTNLTVRLPINGTTYYIDNITFAADLAPEDADAIITWQLYWFNVTSGWWQPYGTHGTTVTMNFVNDTSIQVFSKLENGTYKLVIEISGEYRQRDSKEIFFTVVNPLHPVRVKGDINGLAPSEWYLNQSSLSFTVVNASQWYQYRYYFVEGVHVANQTFIDLISLNFLSDGTYIVHIFVGNDDIQYHHVILTLNVDQEKPTIIITSPVNASTYSGTTLTLEVISSEAMSEWWYRIDDESGWHSWDGSVLDLLSVYSFTNGTHVVSVMGSDLAGNYNITSVTFYINYLAPEFTITTPMTGQWYATKNISISVWLVSDPANITFTYWLKGSTTNYTSTTTKFGLLVSSDGYQVLHVLARNSWTNASSERTVSFWVDTGLPSVLISSPDNQSLHAVPWVNVSYSVLDALSGIDMVTIDLILNGSVTLINNQTLNETAFDLTNLRNGTYWLVFHAWDRVGNRRVVFVTFTIEIPALRLSWNEASKFLQWKQQYHVLNTTHLQMTFSGTHEYLEFQLVPLMSSWVPANSSTVLDLSFVPEGNYTLYLRATRFKGMDSIIVSYYFVIDASAPLVDAVILQVASQQNVTDYVIFDLYVNATDVFSPTLRVLINGTMLDLTVINKSTHLWHAAYMVSLATINESTELSFDITIIDWVNWSSPQYQRTFNYITPTIDLVTWTPDPYHSREWEVAITVTEGSFSLKTIMAWIVTDNGTRIDLSLRKRIGQSTYVGTLDFDSWEVLPSWWKLHVTWEDVLKSNFDRDYWFSPFWNNGLPTANLTQVNPLDDRNSTWYLLVTVDNLPDTNSYSSLFISAIITDTTSSTIVMRANMSLLAGTTESYALVVLLPQPGTYGLLVNLTIINQHGVNTQLLDMASGQPVFAWHDARPVIASVIWMPQNESGGELFVELTDDHGIDYAWVTITSVGDDSAPSWNVTLLPINDTWYHAIINFTTSGNYSLTVHAEDDVNNRVASPPYFVEINVVPSDSSTSPTNDPQTSTEIVGSTGTKNPSLPSGSSRLGNGSNDVNLSQGEAVPSVPFVSMEAVLGLFTILGGGTIGARWYRRRNDGF